MHAVVLLTDPARPALDADRVAALCQDWSGDDLRWLAEGEAAEFTIAAIPNDFEATRAALSAAGIDLNAVALDGRRKRMRLADMDSTTGGATSAEYAKQFTLHVYLFATHAKFDVARESVQRWVNSLCYGIAADATLGGGVV